MLSIFPQLLFLTPLAIALLRVVAGVYIVTIAWATLGRRRTMSQTSLPLVGHAPEWLIVFASVIFGAVGTLLIAGAWTQAAALVAALGSLKLAIISRLYPSFASISTNTCVLLFFICLALIFTGAGAFAFDLPL